LFVFLRIHGKLEGFCEDTLEREMQKRLLMAACLAVCLEDSVCRQGPAASVAIPRPPVGSTYKRQQEDKEEKKNVAARAEKIQRIDSAEFEALQVRTTISFIGLLLALVSSDLCGHIMQIRAKSRSMQYVSML